MNERAWTSKQNKRKQTKGRFIFPVLLNQETFLCMKNINPHESINYLLTIRFIAK